MSKKNILLGVTASLIAILACRSGNLESTSLTPAISSNEPESSSSISPTETDQNEENSGPSNLSPTRIRLNAVSMYGEQPTEGWITYQSFLSIENTEPNSLYLSINGGDSNLYLFRYKPFLETINLLTISSWVSTDEGEDYPATLTFDQPLYILPPKVILTGTGQSGTLGVQVTFKVPELLHPSKLNIGPGISLQGEEPTVLEIDLKDANTQTLSQTYRPSTDLPTQFSVSPNISADVSLNLGKISYGTLNRFGDTTILLKFDLVLKNSDITADQAIEFVPLLVSMWGVIYYPSGWEFRDECDASLPETIGPGQTKTTSLCFVVNAFEGFDARDFYLAIVGNSVDAIYNVQFPDLINCDPAEPPSEINGVEVFSEERISIPSDFSSTVKGDVGNAGGLARFIFKGETGTWIKVSVDPVDDRHYWAVMMTDPGGNLILEYSQSFESDLFNTFRESILCNGEYAIYVRAYEYASNDPFQQEFKLTISD